MKPRVPGPKLAARTLTREKAPLIRPKPCKSAGFQCLKYIYIDQAHQANNIGQNVLVRKDLGLLRLRQLLQVGVGLVQQQVNQIAERLLEQDRKHQANGHLLLKCKRYQQPVKITIMTRSKLFF